MKKTVSIVGNKQDEECSSCSDQQEHDECGDGCCSEYGWTWYVDGTEVHSSPCNDNALLAILEHFGIDAEIGFCSKDDDIDDHSSILY